MDIIVHGADSETYYGRPMTLQFFSDDLDYETCLYVGPENATDGFLEWAEGLPTRCKHVVYVHNLQFDLPEFLWSVKDQLISPGGDFDITIGDWHIHGVYARPTFCHMANRKTKTNILIVDSFLWFQGTLVKAAELYCPHLLKLKPPKDLGTRKFAMNDDGFYAYAMRDAEVAYHIGKSVQKMISEFDIMQPVSLADMSAKIFRHHYLRHTIPQPNNHVILAALKSYHGGKNNVVAGMAPGWHMNVTSIDIKSAFPYSMSLLPSLSYKRLYKRYKITRRQPREVPPLGVYCVSGVAAECDWPVLFHHAFEPIQGKFSRVWIHGYELNEALRSGEVKIKSVRGYYYEAEKDNRPSPFKAYCDDFFERKETEKHPVQKYGYKLILNSCYGKFIQTRKNARIIYTDIDSGETVEAQEVVAGGMFHPFIASAITAHTRAYIHRCEHEYKAIHTATDGFYTYRKRVKAIGHYPRRGLGSLNIEAQGNLCLLRNKCYILYNRTGETKSQYFKGKRIEKFAKHGFQGSVYELERLIAHNKRKYKVTRPNRLRESLKRGLNVNEFIERDFVLKVGPVPVIRA